MERKLTEKQKRFIDYYIETGNQTESARLALYKQPHVQGAQLLEKLRIEIDKRLAAKEDERIASQDEVLRYLTGVMRGEETEQAAILVGNGCQELIEKDVPAKERLKAAELLGKRYGIFTEKIEVSKNIGDTIADIEAYMATRKDEPC